MDRKMNQKVDEINYSGSIIIVEKLNFRSMIPMDPHDNYLRILYIRFEIFIYSNIIR